MLPEQVPALLATPQGHSRTDSLLKIVGQCGNFQRFTTFPLFMVSTSFIFVFIWIAVVEIFDKSGA